MEIKQVAASCHKLSGFMKRIAQQANALGVMSRHGMVGFETQFDMHTDIHAEIEFARKMLAWVESYSLWLMTDQSTDAPTRPDGYWRMH